MSTEHASNRVLIGGIGGTIGSSIASNLSSAGWTVGGFGRPSEKWSDFTQSNPGLDLYDADGTDSAAVKTVFSAFVEKHGGLDAYVHAIGNVFLKPLHMIADAEWDSVMATNLSSAFYASRAAVDVMRRQKNGTIVLFSSVAAQTGLSNHEAIAAAKGGFSSLVRSIAATYASNGIRANAIAPGLIKTQATQMLTSSEQALRISERMHPVGRIGRPEEAASLTAWLVSEDASWMTGQVLGLDGGMGVVVPKPRA